MFVSRCSSEKSEKWGLVYEEWMDKDANYIS